MLKKNVVISIVGGLLLVPAMTFAASLDLKVSAEPTIKVKMKAPSKMGGGSADTVITPGTAKDIESGSDVTYNIIVPKENYPTITFPFHLYKDEKILTEGKINCLINRQNQKWECTTILDKSLVEVTGNPEIEGGNLDFKFKS